MVAMADMAPQIPPALRDGLLTLGATIPGIGGRPQRGAAAVSGRLPDAVAVHAGGGAAPEPAEDEVEESSYESTSEEEEEEEDAGSEDEREPMNLHGVADGVLATQYESDLGHDILFLTSERSLTESTAPFVEAGGRRLWEKLVCDKYIPEEEDRHCLASKFTSATRQLLVDWAFSRRNCMQLSSETVHLAISFTDHFLRLRNPSNFLARHDSPPECLRVREVSLGGGVAGAVLPAAEVPDDAASEGYEPQFPPKLRRLMCTALLVAAKLVERQSLRPSAASFATADEGFRRSELLQAERYLIKELNYKLLRPTPISFACAFLDRAWAQAARRLPWRHLRMEQRVASYVLDVASLSHAVVGVAPSLLGAAAVWLATGMTLAGARARMEAHGEDTSGVGRWGNEAAGPPHLRDAGEPACYQFALGGAAEGDTVSRTEGGATLYPPSELLGAAGAPWVWGELFGHGEGAVKRTAALLGALCADSQQFPALAVHQNKHPLNEGSGIVRNTLRRIPPREHLEREWREHVPAALRERQGQGAKEVPAVELGSPPEHGKPLLPALGEGASPLTVARDSVAHTRPTQRVGGVADEGPRGAGEDDETPSAGKGEPSLGDGDWYQAGHKALGHKRKGTEVKVLRPRRSCRTAPGEFIAAHGRGSAI